MRTVLTATLVALLALVLTPVATAQTAVFADEFDNGVIDPNWVKVFDPLQFWDVREQNSQLQFENLTAPFGAFNEQYSLTTAVPDQFGPFRLDFQMEWNPTPGFPAGDEAAICELDLLDANQNVVASFRLDDPGNNGGGGDFIITGATMATIPGLSVPDSGTMSLIRSTAGDLSYEVNVGGSQFTGSVGTVSDTVSFIRIFFEHSTFCGPCGPFVGPVYWDYVRLFDTAGPVLSTTGLVAGQSNTVQVDNATPNGPVQVAYSLTGGGPTSTVVGTVALSLPITVLPPVGADPGGTATLTSFIPAAASGAAVWVQAYDTSSGELSNGLAETIS